MDEERCLFCAKVAAKSSIPADEFLWDFPHSIALLGPWQYYEGYCVLVSKTHERELTHLPRPQRNAFLDEMCILARAIEEAFHPHKLNYELLGNQVPHLHWHVFPRCLHDPEALKPVWIALDRADRDETERRRLQTGTMSRTEIARKLRDALAAAGDA